MIVQIRLDVTDEIRRRVRALQGRGGLATRKEISAHVERAYHLANKHLPEPIVRARRVQPAPVELEVAHTRRCTTESREGDPCMLEDGHGGEHKAERAGGARVTWTTGGRVWVE